MSSILTTLSTLVTPDTVGKLGKQLGLSDEQIRQGLAITHAVLAGGMARAANTPEGAAAVARLVEGADGNLLGNLTGAVLTAGGGGDVAKSIFGSNLDLVTAEVKRVTGIDIAPLIAAAAPVLLAAAKNLAAQQKLDADGIAKLLQGEIKSLARRDPATGKVLKEVFKPLEAQDKLRASFTDEEWAALVRGPVHAAALVIAADRSGGGGRKQEVEAMRAAVAESVAAARATDLVSMLFRDGVAGEAVEELLKTYRRGSAEEIQARLLAPVVEAAAVAKVKAAPPDARAYQGLLLAVAQKVAGAAKEGGFLGVGGSLISDAEKAAIDSLVQALSGKVQAVEVGQS